MELSRRVARIPASMTLRITAVANEMRAQGRDVKSFAAGEPDFGTPENICAAAKEAIDRGMTRYTPASGTAQLKQAACDRQNRLYGTNYAPENVVCSNGAKHSLFNAVMAVVNPGDEVLLPSPYWLTYPELIAMADGVTVPVETDAKTGYKATAGKLARHCTDRTKAILLNSPANPTGAVYTRRELGDIAELARERGLYIISDEIYDSLVYGGVEFTSMTQISEDARSRTVLVNGMSKSYAMTGWRIGFTFSSPELAKAMGSYQSHASSNPCSISQYAAAAGLAGPQEFTEEMRAAFEKRRDLMYSLAEKIPGVKAHKPDGAFYMFLDVSSLYGRRCGDTVIGGSVQFAEKLLERELTAVIPGAPFGDDGHIRLSFATGEETIKEGLARIAGFIGGLA